MKRLITLAFATLILSGCGTLLIPSNVDVPINSAPVGATVTIDGNVVGETPMTATLDNSDDHVVEVSKDGHATRTCVLNASIHKGIAILNVITLGTSLIVDAITQGWKRLERTDCNVSLPAQ